MGGVPVVPGMTTGADTRKSVSSRPFALPQPASVRMANAEAVAMATIGASLNNGDSLRTRRHGLPRACENVRHRNRGPRDGQGRAAAPVCGRRQLRVRKVGWV